MMAGGAEMQKLMADLGGRDDLMENMPARTCRHSPPAATATSSASAGSRSISTRSRWARGSRTSVSFAKYLGGIVGQHRVRRARLGLKRAMLSRVGDDHMGRFLVETLEREGCDVSQVQDRSASG